MAVHPTKFFLAFPESKKLQSVTVIIIIPVTTFPRNDQYNVPPLAAYINVFLSVWGNTRTRRVKWLYFVVIPHRADMCCAGMCGHLPENFTLLPRGKKAPKF